MQEHRYLGRVGNYSSDRLLLTYRFKPHVRKACLEIVKSSGSEIANILVEKNAEVDTDIMNCRKW